MSTPEVSRVWRIGVAAVAVVVIVVVVMGYVVRVVAGGMG